MNPTIRGIAVCLVGLPGVLAGCAHEAPPPSILLVTLDTTRRDHLGCYGRQPSVTPVLDAVARDGLVFEQAYTVCPLTSPSHASILTGQYPFRHGVRDNGSFVLPESAWTLAEMLRTAGYQTGAALGCVVLSRRYGLAQGFDVYDEPAPQKEPGLYYSSRPASEVNDAAREFLRQRDRDRPFFLWVHYYDPHAPYDPPPEFRDLGHSAYEAEIAAMDHELGRLLESLASEDERGELLTAIVADHGEALGFRGEHTHSIFVYQPLVQVPLLLRLPGGARRGTRDAALRSVVDLFPTLLAQAGVPPPDGNDGQDLLAPGRAEPLVYFESYYAFLQHHWSPVAGVTDGAYKYLHSSRPELYALDQEEEPAADRIDAEPAKAKELRRRMEQLLAVQGETPSERIGMDSETLAQLRDLGYVNVASDDDLPRPLEPPPELPNPADQADVLGLFHQATVVGPGWTLAGGAELLLRLLQEDPDNVSALDHLVRYLIQLQRYAEAREPVLHLLELRPEHAPAWANLGAVLQSEMNIDRAVECYGRSLEIDPDSPSVLLNLAACLQHQGKEEEARHLLERVNAMR